MGFVTADPIRGGLSSLLRGLLQNDRESLSRGLGMLGEVALREGMIDAVDAAELDGLADFLMEPKAAPAPARKARAKVSAVALAAPAWWFYGHRKVKARQTEWAACSPAFQAYVASSRSWWAAPLVSWPDCPERDRTAALREARQERYEADQKVSSGWPSTAAWEAATRYAPTVRFEKDGQQNPEDARAWRIYMQEQREAAWKAAEA